MIWWFIDDFRVRRIIPIWFSISGQQIRCSISIQNERYICFSHRDENVLFIVSTANYHVNWNGFDGIILHLSWNFSNKYISDSLASKSIEIKY